MESQRPSLDSLKAYFWSVLVTLAGTLALAPLRAFLDLSNVALLYALAVLLVAVRFGRGAAVVTALAGSLLFAYVFVPPHFSLAITEAQYLLSAGIMLVVALLVGHLTSRLKQHADFAGRKSAESASLYELARELAGAANSAAVVDASARFFAQALDADEVRVVFPDQFGSQQPDCSPGLLAQSAACRQLLSRPLSANAFLAVVPLAAASGVQGVLLFRVAADLLASQDAVEYIETAASVIAVSLERSHFAEMARETEVRRAAESLRSSVLAALSHDLRTPLTALVGMAEMAASGKLTPERERAMQESIRKQALSISQQMTNLLDMARLTTGSIQLQTAWQPVDEVIGAVLRQVAEQWPARIVHLALAADLPPICIDATLIERVLWNLLENAIKYSPPEQPIELSAWRDENTMTVAVCDAGPGISDEQMAHIFEAFQRGRVESDIPGVGLGLSIARTIVEAHGGSLLASNRPVGGCCFQVYLPLGEPPDFVEFEEEE